MLRRMAKVPYNPQQPDMRLLRLAVFERLRRDPDWHHLPTDSHEFSDYVEFNNIQAPRSFRFHMREVMWQLLTEGVLAPGFNESNLDLPFFHLTQLGRSILESQGPNPFDPEGYVEFVQKKVPNADATVWAYLAESLNTQRQGNLVASAVMLGIAAERVFLLLSESFRNALKDAKHKKTFAELLERFPMKPKLDWVRNKIEELQRARLNGVPDNAGLMIVAIYDLIRQQRNELGHPREQPPALTRDDVVGAIQVFVRYYETAEALRSFLAKNHV
jgi:hypothetical protein